MLTLIRRDRSHSILSLLLAVVVTKKPRNTDKRERERERELKRQSEERREACSVHASSSRVSLVNLATLLNKKKKIKDSFFHWCDNEAYVYVPRGKKKYLSGFLGV